jgi:hypothetical protein
MPVYYNTPDSFSNLFKVRLPFTPYEKLTRKAEPQQLGVAWKEQ